MATDPMRFLLDMFEKYGPMRQTDCVQHLTCLVHRDRRPLIQKAVERGFLTRALDENLNIRVLVRTERQYFSLEQRTQGLKIAGPRTVANGSMTEPIPPDPKLPGRPGQDDFKRYMRKYRESVG